MIFSFSSSSIVLRVFLISFQKEGNDSNEDARANTRTPRSSGSSPIKTAARPSRTQPRVNKKSIYISDLPLATKKKVYWVRRVFFSRAHCISSCSGTMLLTLPFSSAARTFPIVHSSILVWVCTEHKIVSASPLIDGRAKKKINAIINGLGVLPSAAT